MSVLRRIGQNLVMRFRNYLSLYSPGRAVDWLCVSYFVGNIFWM